MSSAAIDTTAISTVCIEQMPTGANPCGDTSHTNNTGTDQIYVKIRYPN